MKYAITFLTLLILVAFARADTASDLNARAALALACATHRGSDGGVAGCDCGLKVSGKRKATCDCATTGWCTCSDTCSCPECNSAEKQGYVWIYYQAPQATYATAGGACANGSCGVQAGFASPSFGAGSASGGSCANGSCGTPTRGASFPSLTYQRSAPLQSYTPSYTPGYLPAHNSGYAAPAMPSYRPAPMVAPAYQPSCQPTFRSAPSFSGFSAPAAAPAGGC